MEIRKLDSRLVYENRWLRVREDDIQYPDGSTSVYGIVEKNDFALVIPVEANGDLWVVEQYRYPIGRRAIEFPQGAWQGEPGADPEALARGELAEETGLRAGKLEHLGRLDASVGFSAQAFDVWVATDLTPGATKLDHEEQGMTARRISRDEFHALLRVGAVTDAHTVAGYALLNLTSSAG